MTGDAAVAGGRQVLRTAQPAQNGRDRRLDAGIQRGQTGSVASTLPPRGSGRPCSCDGVLQAIQQQQTLPR